MICRHHVTAFPSSTPEGTRYLLLQLVNWGPLRVDLNPEKLMSQLLPCSRAHYLMCFDVFITTLQSPYLDCNIIHVLGLIDSFPLFWRARYVICTVRSALKISLHSQSYYSSIIDVVRPKTWLYVFYVVFTGIHLHLCGDPCPRNDPSLNHDTFTAVS